MDHHHNVLAADIIKMVHYAVEVSLQYKQKVKKQNVRNICILFHFIFVFYSTVVVQLACIEISGRSLAKSKSFALYNLIQRGKILDTEQMTSIQI